ncbi:MAG: 6-phosphogluconolactonase [Paracoccaceae bacterium]|nr:6-phosphogluconolactonase [Paracoccaceae bacterium]
MKLVEYPDREMMMMDLANTLAGELNSCLMRHDHASFAVPGGSTPGPMFDVLSGAHLDWARVHVMLTDERWVPEDHRRSNTGLLRRHLLQGRAAAAQYVPIRADTETPEEAIEALAEAIRPEMPVSVMLLGMGTDMHTASLFPGADRLADALAKDAPPLMAMRAPGAEEPRITLTAPVLTGAMSVHVLIAGADKRAALEQAQGLQPSEAPIALVLKDATVHWAA